MTIDDVEKCKHFLKKFLIFPWYRKKKSANIKIFAQNFSIENKLTYMFMV